MVCFWVDTMKYHKICYYAGYYRLLNTIFKIKGETMRILYLINLEPSLQHFMRRRTNLFR